MAWRSLPRQPHREAQPARLARSGPDVVTVEEEFPARAEGRPAGAGARRVDVILPCLDEASALPIVLMSLPRGYRAIVVDNGSSDGSPEIAAQYGALVVNEERKGYGAACHAGLLAATAPLVAFADADASLDLAELPGLVELVYQGKVDLALGRRTGRSTAGWPWHARIANHALAWYLRHGVGLDVSDVPPMRVGRRAEMLQLAIQDRRSGYPLETLLRASRANWRICELDVSYQPRVGKSKVTGTVSGTARAVKDMSAAILRDRRDA
jgi:hypothetical protein